jgi:hypothetical protein
MARFEAPPWLVGGLVVYTVVNTMIPGLTLGVTPEFDSPIATPEVEAPVPSPPVAGGT